MGRVTIIILAFFYTGFHVASLCTGFYVGSIYAGFSVRGGQASSWHNLLTLRSPALTPIAGENSRKFLGYSEEFLCTINQVVEARPNLYARLRLLPAPRYLLHYFPLPSRRAHFLKKLSETASGLLLLRASSHMPTQSRDRKPPSASRTLLRVFSPVPFAPLDVLFFPEKSPTSLLVCLRRSTPQATCARKA